MLNYQRRLEITSLLNGTSSSAQEKPKNLQALLILELETMKEWEQ
jgi:hypothetical protein